MDEKDKTQPNGNYLNAETLEETMDEVVATLAVTHRAAGFYQKRNPSPSEMARSEHVRRKAEAMLDAALDAAAEQGSKRQPADEHQDETRTVH
jgi:hypothetical protein